jgi:hypothetical protein
MISAGPQAQAQFSMALTDQAHRDNSIIRHPAAKTTVSAIRNSDPEGIELRSIKW